MPDVQKAIQAVLSAAETHGAEAPLKGRRPVVCISRDYGCGGEELAVALATRLGVGLYDHSILDRMAKRLDSQPETMDAVEKTAGHLRDLWLYSLFTGHDYSADSYRRHLVNVIVSIGRGGGIVLGRGGHLILARSGALRLRLTGSVEVCAKRVAEEEGLDFDTARRKVEENNRQRAAFIRDCFRQRMDDLRTYDLTINTDHVIDSGKLLDLAVDAMAMIGWGG